MQKLTVLQRAAINSTPACTPAFAADMAYFQTVEAATAISCKLGSLVKRLALKSLTVLQLMLGATTQTAVSYQGGGDRSG